MFQKVLKFLCRSEALGYMKSGRIYILRPLLKLLGSIVGIATGYGLGGPGIESQWGGEIFRTCPDQPWGPPSLLYNGYRVFLELKSGWGATLTPHPLLVPWS